MTNATQGILAEAKRKKHSTIRDRVSVDDVGEVWEVVAQYIRKQMTQMKGVSIPMFGTFTFSLQKIDVGNKKYIMTQRPVFNVSEKLANRQGLEYVKSHTTGTIPVVPLNYAALSSETPYNRETVEACVKEIINSVERYASQKKNVELELTCIGRLSIRDSKVKMKFFKGFISEMDGTGQMMEAMQGRPGTTDSVISDRPPTRAASSNTVILPNYRYADKSGISHGSHKKLPVVMEQVEPPYEPQLIGDAVNPTIEPPDVPPPNNFTVEEGMEGLDHGDVDTDAAIRHIEMTDNIAPVGMMGQTEPVQNLEVDKPLLSKRSQGIHRPGSRVAAPITMATAGACDLNDLVPAQAPRSAPSIGSQRSPPTMEMLHKPHPPALLAPLQRNTTLDQMKPGNNVLTPPGSACGHPNNAGQELCYLCHQRERRNIPVGFGAERKRREQEEEKLIQQYQYMKDAEDTLQEQESKLARRQDLQKQAAFNLGVAEAVQEQKQARDTEFHKSYIFQRRPLTPPRIIKQIEYSGDLAKQVEQKESVKAKKKADEDFLERLEQVQLAEDLAIQREQYFRNKIEDRDHYKTALETQLRFKPTQVPPREPDNEVFGKNDMNNEKMAERRRRAYDLFQEQQDTVAQRKRDNILKHLAEQKEDEEILALTKQDLLEDRANRYVRRTNVRKRLEEDWNRASLLKREKMEEDKIRASSPGMLLHDQCDKYNRCGQCKRTLKNCGESNLWSESRYIPGSRLMI